MPDTQDPGGPRGREVSDAPANAKMSVTRRSPGVAAQKRH